jgi:uncharacterized membrane protein
LSTRLICRIPPCPPFQGGSTSSNPVGATTEGKPAACRVRTPEAARAGARQFGIVDELDQMLRRWEASGIITAAQAEEIRRHETSARPKPRIPLIAEALGYLGAALVLSAALALAAQFWSELHVGVRVVVLLAVTALLLVAGWSIRNSGEPAFHRLASFLWLAAVAGAGFLADVIASDALDIETGFSISIGIAMTSLATALWLLRKTAPQLIGVFAGLAFLIAGISDVLGGDDAFGILFWGVGVSGLMVARFGLISPERTAYALSSIAVLVGAQWAAVEFFLDVQGWALALGLASALALQGLSVAWRSLVLLAFGSAGVLLFLPQIVDEYFGEAIGGTTALLVSGVALIVVALVSVRLRDRVSG